MKTPSCDIYVNIILVPFLHFFDNFGYNVLLVMRLVPVVFFKEKLENVIYW